MERMQCERTCTCENDWPVCACVWKGHSRLLEILQEVQSVLFPICVLVIELQLSALWLVNLPAEPCYWFPSLLGFEVFFIPSGGASDGIHDHVLSVLGRNSLLLTELYALRTTGNYHFELCPLNFPCWPLCSCLSHLSGWTMGLHSQSTPQSFLLRRLPSGWCRTQSCCLFIQKDKITRLSNLNQFGNFKCMLFYKSLPRSWSSVVSWIAKDREVWEIHQSFTLPQKVFSFLTKSIVCGLWFGAQCLRVDF